MSERDRHLVQLIDELARTQTAEDRAYLVESLAYGNLKLEDQNLARSTIVDAARKANRDR